MSMTSSSSTPPIEEIIAECLSKLAQESVQIINALQTLSSLTKVSSHNRTLLFSRFPDSIPAFTALSVSPSPPIQTLALSVLFNLSLNPNLKHSLVLASQPQLLPHLNSILLSPASSSSSSSSPNNANRLAASLTCSLATLDKNKAAFGTAGTVQAVLAAIEKTTISDVATLHLLSSLAELVQFRGNGTLAVRAGAVPTLVRVLRGPNAEELGGTCFATLALLAGLEEGIGAIRAVDGGVVEVLVEGLRRGCMASKDGVSEILMRMFEGDEECVREVARGKPEFSSLLADLAIRGSVKAREKAGVLMKVIMEAAELDCCHLEGNHPWFLV